LSENMIVNEGPLCPSTLKQHLDNLRLTRYYLLTSNVTSVEWHIHTWKRVKLLAFNYFNTYVIHFLLLNYHKISFLFLRFRNVFENLRFLYLLKLSELYQSNARPATTHHRMWDMKNMKPCLILEDK
jgi:hypothetical protein